MIAHDSNFSGVDEDLEEVFVFWLFALFFVWFFVVFYQVTEKRGKDQAIVVVSE